MHHFVVCQPSVEISPYKCQINYLMRLLLFCITYLCDIKKNVSITQLNLFPCRPVDTCQAVTLLKALGSLALHRNPVGYFQVMCHDMV